MKKRKLQKIATWIIVPLMGVVFTLDITTVALANKYCGRYEIKPENFLYENGNDRIHFLNTANSDAIIIESNGKFALVDSGEGNENPRRKTAYKGYEKEVADYIKKVCVGENGEARLDFILGTHCHYDHIGGFHAIISDPEIRIGKAYFKKFDPEIAKDFEVELWKIGETYERIVDDLKEKNVELISDLPDEPFKFGDFTIRFFNTVTPKELKGAGENSACVGVKITKGGKSAFLAADITSVSGVEKLIADDVGDVDLLKAGHHGSCGSSSAPFLKALKPEIVIITNILGKVYPNVKWNLTMIAKAPFYATYDNDGIIASFTDGGEIVLTNHIH